MSEARNASGYHKFTFEVGANLIGVSSSEYFRMFYSIDDSLNWIEFASINYGITNDIISRDLPEGAWNNDGIRIRLEMDGNANAYLTEAKLSGILITQSPTPYPTVQTSQPTLIPTQTTKSPTTDPSVYPTKNPSVYPTQTPTKILSTPPTLYPSFVPTTNPSKSPSFIPSMYPSLIPSPMPTMVPSVNPTMTPSHIPTMIPTIYPSINPSMEPTIEPTLFPTTFPSMEPTINPSKFPTKRPTQTPNHEGLADDLISSEDGGTTKYGNEECNGLNFFSIGCLFADIIVLVLIIFALCLCILLFAVCVIRKQRIKSKNHQTTNKSTNEKQKKLQLTLVTSNTVDDGEDIDRTREPGYSALGISSVEPDDDNLTPMGSNEDDLDDNELYIDMVSPSEATSMSSPDGGVINQTPSKITINDDDDDSLDAEEEDALNLMYDGPLTTGTKVDAVDPLYTKNTNNGTSKGATKKRLSVDSLYSKNSSNNSTKDSIDTVDQSVNIIGLVQTSDAK